LLGDYPQATEYCRQSVVLHAATGNRNGEASAYDSLGYAHYHLGQYDQAISHYRRALQVFRDISDRGLEADTLHHIGEVAAASGDPETARHTLSQALTILDEMGHPDAATIRDRLRALA